jgi:hypothetical protein
MLVFHHRYLGQAASHGMQKTLTTCLVLLRLTVSSRRPIRDW